MSDKLILIASGIAKGQIKQAAQRAGGSLVEVEAMSDIQGAQAIKQGKANYFIGSCATGQGGALSMAIAVLGTDQCAMLNNRGRPLSAEQIREKATAHYRAFGISADHVDQAIPVLVEALLAKHGLKA